MRCEEKTQKESRQQLSGIQAERGRPKKRRKDKVKEDMKQLLLTN